jgi:UrcA family protein
MKQSKLIKSIIVAAAVVAFGLPTAASADSGPVFKGASEKVQFTDLDIQKQAGAEQLYRRLQAASKRVCGVESLKVTGSIDGFSETRRCYHKSLGEAVAKLDNAALTKIHEG